MPARFTTDATTDALRAALIDDDLDDMSPDLIEAIITAYPEAFNYLARRYLIRSWSNKNDVWEEAAGRGYFTADHDD
jgi:hypothetical protein